MIGDACYILLIVAFTFTTFRQGLVCIASSWNEPFESMAETMVLLTVPMNATFASVQLETERQSDLALQEMQDQYR